jgi:hypothetical protein
VAALLHSTAIVAVAVNGISKTIENILNLKKTIFN